MSKTKEELEQEKERLKQEMEELWAKELKSLYKKYSQLSDESYNLTGKYIGFDKSVTAIRELLLPKIQALIEAYPEYILNAREYDALTEITVGKWNYVESDEFHDLPDEEQLRLLKERATVWNEKIAKNEALKPKEKEVYDLFEKLEIRQSKEGGGNRKDNTEKERSRSRRGIS